MLKLQFKKVNWMLLTNMLNASDDIGLENLEQMFIWGFYHFSYIFIPLHICGKSWTNTYNEWDPF